jgi:INO80 complex subunit C
MVFYADLNIQSPPSIYPPKRYCDVTGFEVSFTPLLNFPYGYAYPGVFVNIKF